MRKKNYRFESVFLAAVKNGGGVQEKKTDKKTHILPVLSSSALLFTGLQWQPPSQTAAAEAAAAKASEERGDPAPLLVPLHRPPVENVLESALSLAGAITESNSGNPAKVGWTRSSRTDAGVHSLSTVVSLRAECVPEDFEGDRDPEGIEFSRAVNRHLPDDVRVFSAQRVNGGWCARGMCEAREYEYTLPARILLPGK